MHTGEEVQWLALRKMTLVLEQLESMWNSFSPDLDKTNVETELSATSIHRVAGLKMCFDGSIRSQSDLLDLSELL